jgi:hypothetical protein
MILGAGVIERAAKRLQVRQCLCELRCHRGTDEFADLRDPVRPSDPKDEVPELQAAAVSCPEVAEVD